jgi:hypothetical protein
VSGGWRDRYSSCHYGRADATQIGRHIRWARAKMAAFFSSVAFDAADLERVAIISAEEDADRIGLLVAAACNVMQVNPAAPKSVAQNLLIHDARGSGWRLGEPLPGSWQDMPSEDKDRSLQALSAALATYALPSEIDNNAITMLMRWLGRARDALRSAIAASHTKLNRAAAAEQCGEATLVRAVEFILPPLAPSAGGGNSDAARNVAMKAIDAGVLDDHGKRVALSAGGGETNRRNAMRVYRGADAPQRAHWSRARRSCPNPTFRRQGVTPKLTRSRGRKFPIASRSLRWGSRGLLVYSAQTASHTALMRHRVRWDGIPGRGAVIGETEPCQNWSRCSPLPSW